MKPVGKPVQDKYGRYGILMSRFVLYIMFRPMDEVVASVRRDALGVDPVLEVPS